MFFSISIPVYNAEKYLDDCIESVLRQTEKDYELLLVDDGSKDSSLQICYKWQRRYPDVIRVVEKENSGSLLTRRRCLVESRGDYLYVMDADDYLLTKDFLSIIKDRIISTAADLVFFNATSDPETNMPVFSFPFSDGDVFENESMKAIYEYYISNSGLKPLWNKVFHRNLLDIENDYEKYDYITNGTDYFQSTEIISRATKITYIDKSFYFYRVTNNSESIVHTFKETVYLSARENFIRLKEKAEKWGIPRNELRKMLKKNYMNIESTSAYKIRLCKKKLNNIASYL